MAIPDVPLRKEGFLERTFTRLVMRPWKVLSTGDLSPQFRMLHFESPGEWQPGDKIQIKLDGGLVTRTYTPFKVVDDERKFRIIAYCHGAGPGSEWVRSTTAGEDRPVLGPRSSLSLTSLGQACVLFGDETSIGLAAALVQAKPPSDTRFIFEADDPSEFQFVLSRVGLRDATVIERRRDSDHYPILKAAILATASADGTYVLSGSAPSIQFANRALRHAGVAKRRIRAKAYWAPGRVGLD